MEKERYLDTMGWAIGLCGVSPCLITRAMNFLLKGQCHFGALTDNAVDVGFHINFDCNLRNSTCIGD